MRGDKVSFFTEEEDGLSLRVYNVGREQCKNYHQWGPGVRKFYLIHHVVSGKGILKAGDRQFEINAGETFLIYPNTEILYRADATDPWEYYWVGFHGSDAGLMLRQTKFTPDNPVIRDAPGDEFCDILMKIYEAKGASAFSAIRMAGYLMLALSLLAEHNDEADTMKDPRQFYVQKAREYIAFSYSQKTSVKEMAEYAGISRSQLYRVFMETFQKSPENYLTDYRIQQACQMLKKTKLSIGSIAYSVGFEDGLYFSRVFHRTMKMSPSEYRKKYGNAEK